MGCINEKSNALALSITLEINALCFVAFATFVFYAYRIFLDAGDDLNSTASSELSLSVSRHVEPREDPEVIKQWKENQVKMLQEKDQEEEKAREALKDQAKKELEDWYKQHSEQLSKLQAANRAASISYEQELETTTTKVILLSSDKKSIYNFSIQLARASTSLYSCSCCSLAI